MSARGVAARESGEMDPAQASRCGPPPCAQPVEVGCERTLLNAAMERYAQGENAAFSQVYNELAPRVLRLLLARGCARTAAEDLLQQTFLHMHRARNRYHSGQDVAPWAFSIARRLCVDHWRRQQRERADSWQIACERCDPEVQAIAAEAATQLTRAIAQLPAAQRGAFELVRLHGLSLAEAAASLGTSVTGVKLRLHRAYATLHDAAGEW
jgi:RNA polymerase sigma-70 factor (ECF subfamily)